MQLPGWCALPAGALARSASTRPEQRELRLPPTPHRFNDTEPKGDAKAGPKLIVESSLFRNGRVDLNAEKLAGQKMTIPLPDIHLRDLGKAKGDVTPAELTNEILAAVRKAAVKAIREKGLDQALGQVKGKALKRGREILKKAMGGEQKGAVGSLKKGAAEAGKALKNLLGN